MNQPYDSPPTTLDRLSVGQIGRVIDIDRHSPMYGRMQDMGIRSGTYIRCERISLFGDPVAYRVLRAVFDGVDEDAVTTRRFVSETLIAIRRCDARQVTITRLPHIAEDSGEVPLENLNSFEKAPEAETKQPLIAMAGNPNVGKSSLFNALTGRHRHTGNWTGKTVDCDIGICRRTGKRGIWGRYLPRSESLCLADLPGSYSLDPHSPEEDETLQFLLREPVAAAVVVCEPGGLRRNLPIAYQIAALPRHIPVILCVNLIDEAERHGISVDRDALEAATGFRVVLTSARSGEGLEELVTAMRETVREHITKQTDCSTKDIPAADAFCESADRAVTAAVHTAEPPTRTRRMERCLEQLLTGRATAIPLGILLLALVFWLTIRVSNRPSAWLTELFDVVGRYLHALPFWSALPTWIEGILLDGVYTTLTQVVAVMLPPMTIFFPLFTLMEDVGLLPRIAFNFDRCFHACHACGKQALTMCMGFGCNAVGVTGCRIIDTPRQRLLAILTNSLVPCNGKFPTLIAMLSILSLTAGASGTHQSLISALFLTFVLVVSIVITWLCSKLLSMTLLREKAGSANGFVMEMPPFRAPNIGRILVRSLTERTIFVLGRAVTVAAPAGAILWLLGNIEIDEVHLLAHLSAALNPIGFMLCVDGAVLLALILSAPANELTLPVLLMIYSAGSRLAENDISVLHTTLTTVGWTPLTFVAFVILFLFHAPCTTTILTIRRETGKMRWALAAILLPATVGIFLCLLLRLLSLAFIQI